MAGGRGLTILCLCQPPPGRRIRRVLSPGSPGALWKCSWGPLTSERGLLRQEEEAMGQAHSGRPWQSWVGSHLLNCSPSQLGASLEWGRRGPSICVLGVLTHHPWLCWVTSVQPLDLSGPQTPHSEGQGCLIEAVRPQDCWSWRKEGRENPGSRGSWRLSSPWPGPWTVGFRASWPLPASLLIGAKDFPPSDLDPSSPTNAQPQPLSL